MDAAPPQLPLHTLSPEECIRLLASHHFGRVALVDDAGPIALPVNYAWDAGAVVFRSTTGSKLDAASGEGRLAFEIDSIDRLYHAGWSVVVRGPAVVLDPEEGRARAAGLRLLPWWPPARDRWIAIRADDVTGRRLR